VRTTITLDPDVEAQVKRLMRERGLSFKEAVNTAIRAGLQPAAGEPFRTPTYDMGAPLVDLTKVLRLAGEIEDEEIIRRLASRT
jgi:hypothetical protein